MKLLIVNLLIAVAFFEGKNVVLAGQSGLTGSLQLYAGETDAVNCTNVSGNKCGINSADCDSIFLCIPNVEDPIKVTCATGLTCNAGKCSTIKSPLCEYKDKAFKCNTPGMYPEPSSCKKFNYCVPNTETTPPTLVSTTASCEDGWGYNHITTYCDIRLVNNNCPDINRPVPPCLTAGQNGALRGNSKLYYICMPYSDSDTSLYPNIYKCPVNQRYFGNYNCR